jgi:hypothetical protein
MGLIKFHQMKNGAMGGGCRRFIVVKCYSKDRFEKNVPIQNYKSHKKVISILLYIST